MDEDDAAFAAAPLRDLANVGDFIEDQVEAEFGSATQEGFLEAVLDRYVRAGGTRRDRARAFGEALDRTTRNARPRTCIEGYRTREHNRLGRDALVGFLRESGEVPDWLLPTTAAKSRDPEDAADRYDPRLVRRVLGEGPTEGGYQFPYAGALEAGPRAGEPAYPDGRDVMDKFHPLRGADGMPAVARDAVVAQTDRRFWPCACFRTEATCGDFAPRRGNRGADSDRAYCFWKGAGPREARDNRGFTVRPRCAPDLRPAAVRRRVAEGAVEGQSELDLDGEELAPVKARAAAVRGRLRRG